MAGVFQKAMVWLGLGPDEDYDDYSYGAPQPPQRPAPAPRGPAPGRAPGPGPAPRTGNVQTTRGPGLAPVPGPGRPRPQRPGPRPVEDDYNDGDPVGSVRPLPGRGPLQNDPRGSRREETPTVRPMRPTSAKPRVLEPTSFDDAKEIADRFKANEPVVMDLADVDRDLARRLIDFSSGICYALGGAMERVRPGGYLLVPASVEVSDDERRRLADR